MISTLAGPAIVKARIGTADAHRRLGALGMGDLYVLDGGVPAFERAGGPVDPARTVDGLGGAGRTGSETVGLDDVQYGRRHSALR